MAAGNMDPSKMEVVHLDSIEALKKNQALFDETYELYRRCFPLETEQQAKSSFEAIMKANSKAKGCKESWVILRDPAQKGKVVAAMNFDSITHLGSSKYDAGIHNIFTMVDEQSRDAGLFGKLEQEASRITADMVRAGKRSLGRPLNILIGAEQNNPFLMTGEEVLSDSIFDKTKKAASGLEQFVRRHIFAQSGYALVDARYVQRPMPVGEAGEMQANEALDYVVKHVQVNAKGAVKTMAVPEHVEGKALASMIRQFFKGPSFVDEDSKALRGQLEPEIETLLKNMEAKGDIKLLKPDYAALDKLLNTKIVAELDGKQQQVRLGELPQFREAAAHYFGADRMGEYGLNLEKTAEEAAKKGGKSAIVWGVVAAVAALGGGLLLMGGNKSQSHAERVRESQQGQIARG